MKTKTKKTAKTTAPIDETLQKLKDRFLNGSLMSIRKGKLFMFQPDEEDPSYILCICLDSKAFSSHVVIKAFQTGIAEGSTLNTSSTGIGPYHPVTERHFINVPVDGLFLYEGSIWKKTNLRHREYGYGDILGSTEEKVAIHEKQTVWQLD
jgi:hypothetical protein